MLTHCPVSYCGKIGDHVNKESCRNNSGICMSRAEIGDTFVLFVFKTEKHTLNPFRAEFAK